MSVISENSYDRYRLLISCIGVQNNSRPSLRMFGEKVEKLGLQKYTSDLVLNEA